MGLMIRRVRTEAQRAPMTNVDTLPFPVGRSNVSNIWAHHREVCEEEPPAHDKLPISLRFTKPQLPDGHQLGRYQG